MPTLPPVDAVKGKGHRDAVVHVNIAVDGHATFSMAQSTGDSEYDKEIIKLFSEKWSHWAPAVRNGKPIEYNKDFTLQKTNDP